MTRGLTVFSQNDRASSVNDIVKFARFMGIAIIEHRRIRQEWPEEWTRSLSLTDGACLVANARELADVPWSEDSLKRVRKVLMETPHALFLYGFSGSVGECKLLKELTAGGVVSCGRIESDRQVCWMDFTCPLTGLCFKDINFRVEHKTKVVTFKLGVGTKDLRVMIKIEEEPFLIRMDLGKSIIFLAGCHKIPDLDAIIPKEVSLLSYFSSVVPLMVFLREVHRESCWHSDSSKACFIVDDPLLRMKYGFINYGAFLEVMERNKMSASIAFIPWNFRRTSKSVAKLFVSHPDRLSLSIHGCDHTAAEFGSSDEALMLYRAQKALERMAMHQRLSGLSFDHIMVFPQGIFSTVAVRALKSCGYLGAVNTTAYPVDMDDNGFTLGELLDVAVRKIAGFPVFIRRYPRELAETAFDLFLGKPALLVEHHGFFRNGYETLAEFVERLNSLNGGVEWSNLAKICSSVCLKRVAENGDIHVRFYADQFLLKNDTERPQIYSLFQEIVSGEEITGVRANDRHVRYEMEKGSLKICLSLNPRETAEVVVERSRLGTVALSFRERRMHEARLRIFIRRHLSEYRDNYVEKNRFLRGMVYKGRKLLSRANYKT
jgi:hypothetical protein